MKISNFGLGLGLMSAIFLAHGSHQASAALITFNLEDQVATYVSNAQGTPRPGALTSLSLTQGGITMTITRQGGTAFDLVSNSGVQINKPASWGLISLDPFVNSAIGTGWIFNFSQPVHGFSLELGDYGADSDTATLTGYAGADGTGLALASASADFLLNGDIPASGGFPIPVTGTINADGILSVVLVGQSPLIDFENSVFLDNFVVDTPEPTSLILLATGLIGLRLMRRRAAQSI